MIANITIEEIDYKIDLSDPIDISIPINPDPNLNVNAWYIDPPKFKTVELDGWVGSTSRGGDVNFNSITFNPHSHCTHTETVGHILTGDYSVNHALKTYFYLSELISVYPKHIGGDFIITKAEIQSKICNPNIKSLIIRTLPNNKFKKNKNYSHSNPPYLEEDAAIYLREIGIDHLLIDLPSVDKEKDDGALLCHNAFWNTNGEVRVSATITEFIYVDDIINDGTYILNLQIAPIENDASPSKPTIYKVIYS